VFYFIQPLATGLVISNPNSVYDNCGLQLNGLRANFEALNGPVAGPVSILNFGKTCCVELTTCPIASVGKRHMIKAVAIRIITTS